MGLGVSLFLIAVGAILAFAVHVTTAAVSITTIGVILMAVGALGIVLTLTLWAPWNRSTRVSETDVYRPGDPYAPPRDRVHY